MPNYKDTALLITHYNRSQSLKRLLETFLNLNVLFGEIVVSDDCSKPEHLNLIKELQNQFNFKLISAETNSGLGNNINKGQDAVTLPYTFYVQEDFYPTEKLLKPFDFAYTALKKQQEIDIIRFYAYRKYPNLKTYGYGFSTMIFSFLQKGYGKFYQYSDHPHLRKSNFFKKFGRYAEGLDPEKTEYKMVIKFIQKKGVGLFYEDHQILFKHGNSELEPSTMENERKNWRRSNNIFIALIRNAYRNFKFNRDYLIQ